MDLIRWKSTRGANVIGLKIFRKALKLRRDQLVPEPRRFDLAQRLGVLVKVPCVMRRLIVRPALLAVRGHAALAFLTIPSM